MAVKNNEDILVIRVPKRTPRRYEWVSDRVVKLDMRAIRRPIFGGSNNYERRKFQSPDHLRALCEEYFASCDGVLYNHKTGKPYLDKRGMPVTGQIKPYTISGLALYLDIDTNVLKRYEKGYKDDLGFDVNESDQYSTVIKRARQRIEAYAECRLYDKDGYNGSRFVLDNAFNWLSRKEQAEIENMVELRKLRQQEFQLKKDLLDGEEGDNNITITVTRKKKEEDNDDD
jgi:hypothetical protein